MKKIRTVVFDLGGVLVDWNPRYLYRKLIKDEHEMEFFLKEVCHSAWNERHDEGQPFSEGIAERIREYPRYEELIRAYFDRWSEMLAGPIQGTVEILQTLHGRKEHQLLALSNWSSETFPHARARFEFLNLFEDILVSGTEKLIKPDPRFFRLLSDRHRVDPMSAVFIDDVEKNINAAKALGFEVIHFTSPESLRKSLTDLSVL